jgi:hypothetical protein
MEECIALVGVSRKFKLKCLEFKSKDRATIEDIYWRVFGTSNVTNNEIPTWIVRRFIAQGKGVDINWANAIESTTKKKGTQRLCKRWWVFSHNEERTCISPY